MTDQHYTFRTAIVLPLIYIALFIFPMRDFLSTDPLTRGFFVLRWLSRPEMEAIRFVIAGGVLWIVTMIAMHLIRRLMGQAMLEIDAERIIFRGFVRREIPISQIERIQVRYGDALIRLKQGRPVSIPVLLAADYYGLRRALERVNKGVQRGLGG